MGTSSNSQLALAIRPQPIPGNPGELYLDLMKKALTRALVAKEKERHSIRPHGLKSLVLDRLNQIAAPLGLEAVRLVPSSPENYLESSHESDNRAEDAETMLGIRQLDHMQRCIADVLDKGVPGDLLEAGVWRGGMAIFMRAALAAYQATDRKVYVVDSFAGLPAIDSQKENFPWKQGDMAVSLETVRNNFARYGLLDHQAVFIKGFFSDTLPTAGIRQLAILRVDADLYQSTLDVLDNLYAVLSPGGYAVFDDYQNLPDCRRAIDEFRKNHGIEDNICQIDSRAVYWQKRG